jgi:hypothetical protein
MIDERQLQLMLADHAEQAPESAGIVAAAEAGARRIRRRRRVCIGAALAVTAALALFVPTYALPNAPPSGDDVADRAGRGPLQTTVEIAPGRGYRVSMSGLLGSVQYLEVTSEQSEDRAGAHVVVHDPGTYDAEPLQRGEPVTVQGRPGFYLPDLPARYAGYPGEFGRSELPSPVVGWADPSGAWVVVLGTPFVPSQFDRRQRVLAVAEAVRTVPPHDVLAPFHLRYVPPGLAPLQVDLMHAGGLGFVILGTYSVELGSGGTPGTARNLRLVARDRVYPDPSPSFIIHPIGEPVEKIGGHDTWYWESADAVQLMLHVGRCEYRFTSRGPDRLTRDELSRIAREAELVDCNRSDKRFKPLP